MNPRIKILGYGEIGKAIEKIYLEAGHDTRDIAIKDLGFSSGNQICDILYIAIPFTDKISFVHAVNDQIRESDPNWVIVLSTVAPGTCLSIQKANMSKVVVHSPVTGVHPRLDEGMRTFTRYIGHDYETFDHAIPDHFEKIGIEKIYCLPFYQTELLKLLCTTYYGLCIAFHAEVQKIMEEDGDVNGELWRAFIHWNQDYNRGYKQLGKRNVIRPVLPELKLPIGGHCVVPNARILKKYYDSPIWDLIIKWGE